MHIRIINITILHCWGFFCPRGWQFTVYESQRLYLRISGSNYFLKKFELDSSLYTWFGPDGAHFFQSKSDYWSNLTELGWDSFHLHILHSILKCLPVMISSCCCICVRIQKNFPMSLRPPQGLLRSQLWQCLCPTQFSNGPFPHELSGRYWSIS